MDFFSRSGVVAGVPLLVFTRLPHRLRLLFMNRVVSVGAILVIALDQFSEAPNRAITRIAPTGHFFYRNVVRRVFAMTHAVNGFGSYQFWNNIVHALVRSRIKPGTVRGGPG